MSAVKQLICCRLQALATSVGSMENLPSEESKHTEKRKELLDSCWEEISGEITVSLRLC